MNLASDVELLQTDVMRFMAIIAFCLMAVLALVKHAAVTAPAPAAANDAAPVAEAVERTMDPTPPTPRPQPRPEPEPEPAEVVHETAAVPPASERRAVQPAAVPKPLPEPTLQPPPVAEQRSTSAQSAPEETASAPAEPAPDPAEGLTLRFESDQDFMRLLSRGDMQLYGWDARRALVLDRDFRFVATTPPARLHEVMPATIPRTIARIAPDEPLTWGVALPSRTETAVNALAGRHDVGELVINRYGEVRHETR